MRFVLVLGAGAALLVVLFLVVLRSLGAGSKVDCSGFTLEPGQWQAASPDARSDLQQKIAGCRSLQGKTPEEVVALLGPPDRGAGGQEPAYYFAPGDDVRLMYVTYHGGKVVQVGRTDRNSQVP